MEAKPVKAFEIAGRIVFKSPYSEGVIIWGSDLACGTLEEPRWQEITKDGIHFELGKIQAQTNIYAAILESGIFEGEPNA